MLCSQPGADAAKFAALKAQLARLQRATAVAARGQAACLDALCAATGGPAGIAAAADGLQAALARGMALAAAACAGAAQALAHMPALAPCSGAALAWRPLPAGTWADARGELAEAAHQAASAYQATFGQEGGLEFALSLQVEEVRGRLGRSGGIALLCPAPLACPD